MSEQGDTGLHHLRESLREKISPKRFAHILGVEQTVARMAELYCPEKRELLCAAALLHDCTKEYDEQQTKAVLAREGVRLRPDEKESPQIWHAITAPLEIPRFYPAFADAELLSMVRWHTTGHTGMTLPEALLYLADVIEPTRDYPTCVALRERFWGADLTAMTHEERAAHLCDVLRSSMTGVRESLMARGLPVCEETLCAIEYLKKKTHL